VIEHEIQPRSEGLIDYANCSCGWQSNPYYDGRDLAKQEWVLHAAGADLQDFASLMVDEVIAKTKIQLDPGKGLSVADQRLMLEQLIVERRRNAKALPTSEEAGA